MNKPMIGVAALVVVAAAGGWYYLRSRHAPPPAPAAQQTAVVPDAEPAIAHPLPSAGDSASQAPLPTLANSDVPMSDALAQVMGAGAVKDYLLPENIIRHLVVTIDNLPRQKVAVQKRPTAAVGGSFVADGDELHATLDPKNYARYQPMVAVISKTDMHQLAAVYVHYYPLFQQSYQNLGYPNGYFNDRLVQVIDDLLAAPQPAGPIVLVRP